MSTQDPPVERKTDTNNKHSSLYKVAEGAACFAIIGWDKGDQKGWDM